MDIVTITTYVTADTVEDPFEAPRAEVRALCERSQTSLSNIWTLDIIGGVDSIERELEILHFHHINHYVRAMARIKLIEIRKQRVTGAANPITYMKGQTGP